MNLCVIPARGGSKRIPRKNIREFCGKPMIAWSIEAATASECFDTIIVSTDDDEIATIAERYGAEVPFIRPADLADDHTGTTEVIKHAIKELGNNGMKPSSVTCLYATAPFVLSIDLRTSLSLLFKENVDYVFSVTSFPFPIQRAIRVTETNRVQMFTPEHLYTRSQDLEEAWHDAGQFYCGMSSSWLLEKPIFSEYSIPYKLPRYQVQDIDTMEDWKRAEMMFKTWNSPHTS